jgi:hypothetical protein
MSDLDLIIHDFLKYNLTLEIEEDSCLGVSLTKKVQLLLNREVISEVTL